MKYHKIYAPFERDNKTHKLKLGKFSEKEFEALQNARRIFTDKIDGTNIRIYRDGHDVSFAGRKENSEIPTELHTYLQLVFSEEMFEEKFKSTPVVLYGEGCGGKIQGNSAYYGDHEHLVLFDVLINGVFLEHENVRRIAKHFGVESVPIVLEGTLWEGIELVKNNNLVEGIVGVPYGGMLNRKGERIIVKLKNEDFTF